MGTKTEWADWAYKLYGFGATEEEIECFFENPTEDDWLLCCLILIKQDRFGINASRKARRCEHFNKRRRSEPALQVKENARRRIWAALKGKSNGRLFSRLGFSVQELMAHLEVRFQAGMSWNNYGKWHVDHIKPCALFNQLDPVQFAECWNLSNLQPLWALDNIKKGARYAGVS